jgi:hypothetical protein
MAILDKETLSVLDGGWLVRADGRIQRGSEAGEDGFAISGHAVPVMHHQ